MKWEPLHLILDNYEEEQVNYYDKIENIQDKESSCYEMRILLKSERWGYFDFWDVSSLYGVQLFVYST